MRQIVKKILALVLAVVIPLCLFPTAAHASPMIIGELMLRIGMPVEIDVFVEDYYDVTIYGSPNFPNGVSSRQVNNLYIVIRGIPAAGTASSSTYDTIFYSSQEGINDLGAMKTLSLTVLPGPQTIAVDYGGETDVEEITLTEGFGPFKLDVYSKDGNGEKINVGAVDASLVDDHQPKYAFSVDKASINVNTDGFVSDGGIAHGDSATITITSAETGSYEAASPKEITILIIEGKKPEATPNAAIDYANETLTGLNAGSIYTFNDAPYVAAETYRNIEESWFGNTLSIVRQSNNPSESADSLPQELPIPARPGPPGVAGVNETITGKNDGKITGVTAAMEYSSNNGASWTNCAGTEITDLPAGGYLVRYKAVTTPGSEAFAGTAANVTIASEEEPTYTLTVTAPAFASVAAGYDRPDAQSVSIINTGNSDATISEVTVSGAAFETGGSGSHVPAGGSVDAWTVQPVSGLDAGIYTETITVAYNGGEATASVSFTVGSVPDPIDPDPTDPDPTDPPSGSGGSSSGSRRRRSASGSSGGGSGYIPPAPVITTFAAGGLEIPYTVADGAVVASIGAQETRGMADGAKGANRTVQIDLTGLAGLNNAAGVSLTLDPSLLSAGDDVTFTVKSPFGDCEFTAAQLLQWFGGGRCTLTLGAGSLKVSVSKDGQDIIWNKLSPMMRIGVPFKPEAGQSEAFAVVTGPGGRVMPTSAYEAGMVWADIFAPGVYDAGYTRPPTYADAANHRAKADVDYVTLRGLVSGTSAAAFSPDAPMTRAALATALGMLSGADVSGYKMSRFTDVSSTDPAMPYIQWAVANKTARGAGDNTFAPDGAVTRGEMSAAMRDYATALGYALPGGDVSAWETEGASNPAAELTRAEASSTLRRFVELVIGKGTSRG